MLGTCQPVLLMPNKLDEDQTLKEAKDLLNHLQLTLKLLLEIPLMFEDLRNDSLLIPVTYCLSCSWLRLSRIGLNSCAKTLGLRYVLVSYGAPFLLLIIFLLLLGFLASVIHPLITTPSS